MSTISILATVVIRLASYGGGVTFEGGDLGIATYLPGWEGGVPKDVCRVTNDWRQETNGVSCVYRVKFLKDIDLECVGLAWRMNAALTAKRDWSADGKTRQVPEKLGSLGLGGGSAQRFTLPLPEGQTLVAEFPERVNFTAQDGRRWGDKWFLRFGPALGRRMHPAGEELVYRVKFSSPDGIRLERSEKCTMAPGANWTRLENRKDIQSGSALDFSGQGLQDAPAGKYGWLKAVGGRFEFAGRPGVGQRFYGVNLCFTACYPAHEDAELLVDRFVRFGYNTIRIHHHDDLWSKKPELRERLDYLIAKAIERGLYVTTDLYVSRKVTWKELGRDLAGGPDVQLYKSLVLVDDAAYANWSAFAGEFLEHVNPYTKRAYKDEPGMPLVSLINEGNLGMGFGYSGKATDPSLLAAWRTFTGDPQAAAVPNPWANDRARAFDEEMNRRFVKKATAFLRGLGAKALLTNDNNGGKHGEGEGLTPLYDYVDNHFYIDHPEFLENRWRLPSKCPNVNPVKAGQPKMFAKGYAKGATKPYAITEWNFSGPGRYRALGGILTGALAARDEWDALWRFAYSHSRDNWKDSPDQCPGYFDCATDPLSQASDRASVCLFLRGDAQEGTVTTDEKTGAMSFVSPRTCGGFVESGRFKAGKFAADVSGAPAAVWASSLDGKPLAESARMLVVHLTDVQGEGNVYADDSRKILLKWGKGCLVEKGAVRVAIAHPGDLTAWALDTTGRRVKKLPVTRKGEWILFDCSTAGGTIYYELVESYERDLAGFCADRDRWSVHVGERVEAPTNGFVTVRIPQGEWGFWADYVSFPGMRPFAGPSELVLEQETDLRGNIALTFAEYLGQNTPGPRVKVRGRLDKVMRFVTGLDPKKRYQLKTLEVRPENPQKKELHFAIRSFRGVFDSSLAEAVTVEAETGNPLYLVRDGRDERAELVFNNPCARAAACTGSLTMKGPSGEQLPVKVDCTVPAHGRFSLPLSPPSRKGVWLVQGDLKFGDGSVKKVDTRFAKVDFHEAGPKQPYGTFRFGINYHMERYAPYDRRLTIASLNACGAKLVRSSLGMKVSDVFAQEGRKEMDFTKADRLLGELERAGLSVNAGSFGIPKWLARADFRTNKVWQTWHISLAPSNVIERVAEAAARRYGTRVDYYECGNEWDLGFRHPVADAIEIQRQFYTGLKRGNPKVKVITNGWTVPGNNEQIKRSGHEDFQENFLKAAKDWFDVYPVHIHSVLPNYVNYIENAMFPLLKRTDCGDKPWYSNESALTTHWHGERKAAEHVWKKILYAWSKGSQDYIWYNLRGTGWDPSDAEQAYGLVRADYRPRETYAAFAALTAILGGGTFRRTLCGEAGRYVLEFADASGTPVLVAWDGNGKRPVFTGFTLATDAAKVERVDLFGNRTALATADGKVRFAFGNEPAALVLTGATRLVPDERELRENAAQEGKAVDIPPAKPGRRPDFILNKHAQVTDIFEANPAEVGRLWRGPEDTSAKAWLAAEPGGIRLRVDVTDDVHAPAAKGGTQYCGDDVQVHFSSRRQQSFWEFGLAQASDGAPDVFCWHAPGGFSPETAAGKVRLSVTREDKTTRYDAFFPLAALGFGEDMLREGVRFNLLVNDNDGTGRDLMLEIARGSFKDPGSSPLVRFR